ncbi:MAG: DUF2244 domain-containing protein [Tepidimonas sp.]|uniref:DUF2244 domain-containing protein n=1 Tax=Tepidimonas sp. TaxID=2002775 RepID=UPI00259ED5CC|nr:DUF2244 domain-containing protein [Tepidimonas sp.]MDM7457330.1 DUF2244 domain-containing protein [Tepidimonas sp.]
MDASPNGVVFQLALRESNGWRWLLKRNCALTPRQCLVASLLACAGALSVAGAFWAMGARLVLPFALLESSAVALAFLWYARHATDRETLILDEQRLVVEWEQAGAVRRSELARHRLRVDDGGQESGLVELRAGAARVQVGRYIRPEQRRQLARELRWALAGHRSA